VYTEWRRSRLTRDVHLMFIGPCIIVIVVLQPAKRPPLKTSRTKSPTHNELRKRRPMW